MTKRKAIEDAQVKADLSKLDQMVFRDDDGVTTIYDYTTLNLWDRRKHRQPAVKDVTIVTPATTSTA